jgi:hypothetical protein
VKPFRLIDSQVGAVFMINGRVVGLDAFGKPGTFSEVFKKRLESYALDAIDWYDPDKGHKTLKKRGGQIPEVSPFGQRRDPPVCGPRHRLPAGIQENNRLCPGPR